MANALLELKQNKAAALDAQKAARDSAGAILGTMAAEKRTEMTADERKQFADLHAKIESIGATVEAYEKQETAMAAASNIPSDQRGGVRTEVRDNVLDKPWGPEPRNAETKEQRRNRISLGAGEYLQAVKVAELKQRSGSKGDLRLYALNDEYERRAVAAGSSEQVPSDGGFLVYPDFAEEVLMLAHETGVVHPMTRDIPLSEGTNAVKIPAVDEQSRKDGSRWGGVQCFWESEAQSLTGSKPAFNMIEMLLVKLTGLYYATNEVLSDARQLGAIALQAFGEEFGFKLDDGCLRGTGTGQMSNSELLALVTVAKTTNQATQTINYTNIKTMWSRMWNKSRKNAVWLIEQDAEPQLYGLVQEAGVGGIPVYLPPGVGGALYGGATAEPYARLFNRPVITIEQCSTVGTTGDILLTDWSQYLTINKGGVQSAYSSHVQFLTDQGTYRYILRCNGQSWWKTAITPAQGSNTRSPWVALASR